jgi:4-diphosphocytidyl-2-C-methyl-D-erythritol kinase
MGTTLCFAPRARTGKWPGCAAAHAFPHQAHSGSGGPRRWQRGLRRALRGLAALWGLEIPEAALGALGLTLGADVPYCLAGGFCRVRGIGERIEHLGPGPGLHLAVARLGGGLSTPEVFRAWDGTPAHPPADARGALEALRTKDFDQLRRVSHNALIAPAAALMPEIPERIRDLYAMGALFAQMSGSGSAVYGVFRDGAAAHAAAKKLGKKTRL